MRAGAHVCICHFVSVHSLLAIHDGNEDASKRIYCFARHTTPKCAAHPLASRLHVSVFVLYGMYIGNCNSCSRNPILWRRKKSWVQNISIAVWQPTQFNHTFFPVCKHHSSGCTMKDMMRPAPVKCSSTIGNRNRKYRRERT